MHWSKDKMGQDKNEKYYVLQPVDLKKENNKKKKKTNFSVVPRVNRLALYYYFEFKYIKKKF